MTGAKVPLQRLMSDVAMKSRGEYFDGIDFDDFYNSNWENSATGGPQNGWYDSTGSNGLLVKTEAVALLMLYTTQ